MKEIFASFQGEGWWSGTACVFVRFAGCNIWTGREDDRTRDRRNGLCAAWCDTDFVGIDGEGGGVFDQETLVNHVRSRLVPRSPRPTVILTGGEPSLQVDENLIEEFHRHDISVHIETNGSKRLPASIDWVTMSAKPPTRSVLDRVDEVKLVFDPSVYDVDEHWRHDLPTGRHFLQPKWTPCQETWQANMEATRVEVERRPWWRLSLQTHKFIGRP